MIQNWARTLTYGAQRVHYPESVAEIQEIVSHAERVKVIGSRHSFSDIADTTGDLISLSRIDRVIRIDQDPDHPTVTVGAGIAYGRLAPFLYEAGYALHNLASLPHISVVGACATATHGSGVRNGTLATAVSAMEVVQADGTLRRVSRKENPEEFDGWAVNLGALGVVTRVTLDIVPTFDVRQEVWEELPLAEARERFEEIMANAYSVSLFTDWRAPRFNQVWFKRLMASGGDIALRSGRPATVDMHPLIWPSAIHATEQRGIRGPWHERLPHFRMAFTPSSGEELQTEFFIARADAPAALEALYGLRDRIAPILQICEVRTIARDDHWMSPAFGRDSAALHFTWRKNHQTVKDLLPALEDALAPFDARPHWAKVLESGRPERRQQVQSLYPRLRNFQDLLARNDPNRKFGNAFLERWIY